MRAKYIFAEECLCAIAPLLSLPAEQSMCDPWEEPAYLGDLHVILIPPQNVPGQFGAVLTHRSDD